MFEPYWGQAIPIVPVLERMMIITRANGEHLIEIRRNALILQCALKIVNLMDRHGVLVTVDGK